MAMLVLFATDDLGSGLLFYGIFLGMLYVATARIAFVAAGVGLFIAGSFAVYQGTPHVRERVLNWIQPWTTHKIFCPLSGQPALPPGLPELSGGAVALLDRPRRHGRDRARERHVPERERRARSSPT